MKKRKPARMIFLLVLAACYMVAGVADYHRGRDKRIIYSHRAEHHPVINDLFAGKIRHGQAPARLLSSWPTGSYSSHDKFTTLYYAKGSEATDPCCWDYSVYIQVVAMDNKLVKAVAVEGVLSETEYIFFNTMDAATEDSYWDSRLRAATARRW